jgi:hypothetical protein
MWASMAFASPLTSEQEVLAVKSAVSPILATGGYTLVEGSINLQAYHAMDGVRILWNGTAGWIPGAAEYFRFYRVSFSIRAATGEVSRGATYMIVSDYERDCEHNFLSCSQVVMGLLTQNQHSPTLSDILKAGSN